MRTNSTSLKLLLIFIISSLVLISLFHVVVGHSLRQEVEVLNAQAAVHMTRLMKGRRSNGEVILERAERFAERSGLRFSIATRDQEWLSEESFQPVIDQIKSMTFKDVPIKHIPKSKHHAQLNVGVIRFEENRIYKVRSPKAVFFIEIPDKSESNLGLFSLVSLFFLGLIYIAIRYLFAPLSDIKNVVSEVSNGNLTARTNIQRNDDLGELANKIDIMAKQIQQRVESKRSLLLGISHELRTPLTSARINAEMLEDKGRRESITDDLTQMSRIIAELTEAEKLSEHSAIHRTATNINQLVTDLLNESFSGESIDTKLLDNDPYLNIDATRIKLLIKNLLNNAIKFTPKDEQEPMLLLTLNKEQLLITITDFGVGVEESQLQKLKEPFHRVDSARQRETGGYGLGLYLCDVISKAHNGNLQIKSKMGKGTTVIATIGL